ncbi:hypothetical protein GGR50DRAFT_694159 [Xylaria sp. CBS 124048]|nr:hypothetical protein GGR50DRAFT_694159 [Xylaria sp. CBS 124048]
MPSDSITRLGFPTNPYQLATLFLATGCLMHMVTFFSPSPLIYLVRADLSTNDANVVTSTAWFSTIGHCIADASTNALSSVQSCKQTSHLLTGYDVTSILEQMGLSTTSTSTPTSTSTGRSSSSSTTISLTQPLAILNIVSMSLSFLGIVAFQANKFCEAHRRLSPPHWSMFMLSVASTLLAFIASVVTLAHQHTFLSYIAHARPEGHAAYTVASFGPAAYAVMAALVCELAANSVGFYTCIGGKYRCEGTLDEYEYEYAHADEEESGARTENSIPLVNEFIPDEKCAL